MPLLLLFLFLLTATQARAQGFVIDVPGGRETPLALAAPQTPNGDPAGDAKVLDETIRQDLDLSGYFQMINPAAHLERPGSGVEPGTFAFEDWTLLKAAVLVKPRLLPPGDAGCDPTGAKLCVDVFVYYVVTGDKLVSKRFRAEAGSARHLGHRVANEVLAAVTGRPGFFGIALAAVGSQGGNKEIFLLGLDGRGAQAATRNGSINLSPAWSPDGGSLAWTSYKKSNPDLYVKDLGSGRTRVLSSHAGINSAPAWSPDGSKIALARSKDGDSDIFVIDARTGAVLEQITRGGGIDTTPSWSADGRLLVFASERSGGSQIYARDMTAGTVERISFAGDFNSDPMVSPDGSRLAFVTRVPGGFDILVADLATKQTVRVTQDMGDNEDPSWSPDGQYLLFSSTRTGRQELWLATADGRHQVQITRTGGWSQPVFAPK